MLPSKVTVLVAVPPSSTVAPLPISMFPAPLMLSVTSSVPPAVASSSPALTMVLPVSSVSGRRRHAMVPLTSLASASSPLPRRRSFRRRRWCCRRSPACRECRAAVAHDRPAAFQRHRAAADKLERRGVDQQLRAGPGRHAAPRHCRWCCRSQRTRTPMDTIAPLPSSVTLTSVERLPSTPSPACWLIVAFSMVLPLPFPANTPSQVTEPPDSLSLSGVTLSSVRVTRAPPPACRTESWRTG